MTDRSQKISKGIDDAKTNAMLLEKSKAEYEEALTKARAEANKIFQESKKQAMDEKSVMLEETRVSVTELVEKGKKTLEAEKMKMVEEAKAEIVKLAMLATEKLISTKQNINDL
jgi:F0F1-type ATP synthase membrane subunit b/b'